MIAGVSIDLAPDIAWHDQQRIEQIVFLLVAALAAATASRKNVSTFLNLLPIQVRWGLGFALLLGLVSAFFSRYPRFAGLEWSNTLLLIVSTLLLAAEARASAYRFDYWASTIVVAVAAIIALKFFVSYVASLIEHLPIDTRAMFEDTFSNRRVFGQVASMLLPLLAYPILSSYGRSRLARHAILMLLSLCWVMVIASGTRGTWLALGGASTILLLTARRVAIGWLTVQIISFGIGALLFVSLFKFVPDWLGTAVTIENRVENFTTLSGREVLWAIAWVEIIANPWLGLGPMHFASIYNRFGAHPHNAVLQLAAEWGIPAMLGFVSVVGLALFRMVSTLRSPNTSQTHLMVCMTAAVSAASLQALVDGVIVIPYTQTFLVFVAGWALGCNFRGCTVRDNKPTIKLVPFVSIFAAAVFCYGVFPEVFNRGAETAAYVEAGHTYISPRFWGVGWIP